MLPDKDDIIGTFALAKSAAFDTTALAAEQDELQSELLVVSELLQQCMKENVHVALDQTEYQKRCDGLTKRFSKTKSRLDTVTSAISDKQARQATIDAFLDELRRLDVVTEFQPAL